MTRLVVVGGGIAGLTAAWVAGEQGFDVLLLEAASRVGGKLQLAEVAGVAVDVGAEAVLTTRPEALALIDASGLDGERIAPLTTAARVRAAGVNRPLPARTLMGIPTDVDTARASGLLGDDALRAIAAEPSLPPLEPLSGDVAVGALVRARLGDEVVDRLVEPLLGGVYAGRADELSLAATMPALARHLGGGGSLIDAAQAVVGAGARPPGSSVFATLRGGLGRLPIALAASGRFSTRTSTTVRAIRRVASGFELDCGASEREVVPADAVIVAVPAAKAARLLGRLAPDAATELAGIESASMAIVTLAFDGVELPEGSGLLVGAGERLAVKAVTLSTRKWPLESGRISLLRASIGRAGESQALRFDDADLVALVRHELRAMLGVSAAPIDALVTRWGGGLPQYAVGHVDRVARVRASVAGVPGLAVCGAAYDGVGVPACIAGARAAVTTVASVTR